MPIPACSEKPAYSATPLRPPSSRCGCSVAVTKKNDPVRNAPDHCTCDERDQVFPHALISRNIRSSDYCRRRYYIDAGACKGREVDPLDFMAGLAALVPPPRIHQMR
jgi:hypothetical protein